ncbi:hypothetical protein HL658_06170 [Azospirillum sp. RWY-5-1]|uniref:Apea-like HEPN domain-containing protein n=1 Tax=Azospirillum oleiclasticum TaxID=2735135 RepID=A0ABX2T4N5_9PROT|nr:hypothetical protein [Azospirillum oleiclasticum]NYZ12129.1 hypothetical protein [Azospirillum oleiclasticum]NYZ19289.1 hypothetical protein [Azospirillum oleiclasticum]
MAEKLGFVKKQKEVTKTSSPFIPFEFDPLVSEIDGAHLFYSKIADGVQVNWPLAGCDIVLPEGDYFPNLSKIEERNKNNFKAHGFTGFSIGNYHEFFINSEQRNFVCFKSGELEITFGTATPIAAIVFQSHYKERYYGEWSMIESVRIVGADFDEAEQAFINSCIYFEEHFRYVPELLAINEAEIGSLDECADGSDCEIIKVPPIVSNIEPLRFFYSGLVQYDDMSACIYFYRVIEYYSFFENANQIKGMRNDHNISDADFSKRIVDLLSKDEKATIFKTINKIVDKDILDEACSHGVIKSPQENLLNEAIYALRNSIVHGKFSYGYTLRSGSAIEIDAFILSCRKILKTLAKRALERFGSKKII